VVGPGGAPDSADEKNRVDTREKNRVGPRERPEETTMTELLVDFITSLDGYASADGWPGWWGPEGPEYLGWLEELEKGPEGGYTMLMGRKTYEMFLGFQQQPEGGLRDEEEATVDLMAQLPKVVFSSTLEEPLAMPNTTLVRGDAVAWVREQKEKGGPGMRTVGSLSLARALVGADLVDRFRVVMFPVITGRSGSERIYDGYPDVMLELLGGRTFDGRSQLVEYRPRVIDGPPSPQGV